MVDGEQPWTAARHRAIRLVGLVLVTVALSLVPDRSGAQVTTDAQPDGAGAQEAQPEAAPPQTANGIRIAVIDMQKIMSDSKAVQSIQRQIDKQREQYQSELQRRERELREANEGLARERNVLSEDAFRQKRRRLEEQVTELQREIQRSKRRLDRNYSQAMRQVQDQLVQIVRDLATQQDIDMVLGKATVVIVRPRLDLTDRALKRLNAELSSVDVPPLKQ
jgi:Skp family chaperone for outer membrane proteins